MTMAEIRRFFYKYRDLRDDCRGAKFGEPRRTSAADPCDGASKCLMKMIRTMQDYGVEPAQTWSKLSRREVEQLWLFTFPQYATRNGKMRKIVREERALMQQIDKKNRAAKKRATKKRAPRKTKK